MLPSRSVKIGLGALVVVAGGLGVLLSMRQLIGPRATEREPGYGAAVRQGEGPVRSAGPDAMRSEPTRGWTAEDEASDESFPASDPPGQGVAR